MGNFFFSPVLLVLVLFWTRIISVRMKWLNEWIKRSTNDQSRSWSFIQNGMEQKIGLKASNLSQILFFSLILTCCVTQVKISYIYPETRIATVINNTNSCSMPETAHRSGFQQGRTISNPGDSQFFRPSLYSASVV